MWTSVETVRSCATRMLVVSIWLAPTTVSVVHPSTETESHVKVHLTVAYLLTVLTLSWWIVWNSQNPSFWYHTVQVVLLLGKEFYTVKIYSSGIRAVKLRQTHFESKSHLKKRNIFLVVEKWDWDKKWVCQSFMALGSDVFCIWECPFIGYTFTLNILWYYW